MDNTRRIKPIDGESARSLCRGQVILDMAGICKELIENALDASAKNIGARIVFAFFYKHFLAEIRLTNYGANQLEVVDDGCGVSTDQIENLCKFFVLFYFVL
jgi:DNA mismatch repair protein PMS2